MQRFKDAWLIRQSGLLRENHYRSQFYKELKSDRYLLRLSPVLHYVFFGASGNKNPNEFFDTEYYRDHSHGLAKSGRNPLAYFLAHGAGALENPGPFFDTTYYLEQRPDITASGLNPLSHYFQYGRSEGTLTHRRMASLARPSRPMPSEQAQGRRWLQSGLGVQFRENAACRDCPANLSNRYIRFDWDPGGWNNIRMQVEVLVCLARRYQRTLILPPADNWYLIAGDKTHLFDYFDESAFRAAVPVWRAESSTAQIKPADEWKVPARLAAINSVRLKWTEFDARQNKACWFFPKTTRMFGRIASVLGGDFRDYQLLHTAFRIRDDLLNKASERLERHGLRSGDYVAAHIRRGDFEQYEMRNLSTTQIIQALRRHGADVAGKVLIVSDEWDENLLNACHDQGWSTVCWSNSQNDDDKSAGVMDMLSCCLAWRFVGTQLSTFSQGIIQWRGYLSLNAGTHIDALPRFTAELDQLPWWGIVDEPAWMAI